MTVDAVLALVALFVAVALVLLAWHARRRAPGLLCQKQPATVRDACSARCPACSALTKASHR